MIESVKESLIKWSGTTSERAKLQHAYMTLAIALILGAGIVGLMNHSVGQNILVVAIISAGVFLTNAVVWAMLQSAVLGRLPRQTSSKSTKAK